MNRKRPASSISKNTTPTRKSTRASTSKEAKSTGEIILGEKEKDKLEQMEQQKQNEEKKLIEEKLQCGICMEDIANQGLLDSCTHLFCIDCIKKWSESANTCPMCKKRFHKITEKQLTKDGKRKSVTIRVPHRDQRPDSDDFEFVLSDEEGNNIISSLLGPIFSAYRARNILSVLHSMYHHPSSVGHLPPDSDDSDEGSDDGIEILYEATELPNPIHRVNIPPSTSRRGQPTRGRAIRGRATTTTTSTRSASQRTRNPTNIGTRVATNHPNVMPRHYHHHHAGPQIALYFRPPFSTPSVNALGGHGTLDSPYILDDTESNNNNNATTTTTTTSTSNSTTTTTTAPLNNTTHSHIPTTSTSRTGRRQANNSSNSSNSTTSSFSTAPIKRQRLDEHGNSVAIHNTEDDDDEDDDYNNVRPSSSRTNTRYRRNVDETVLASNTTSSSSSSSTNSTTSSTNSESDEKTAKLVKSILQPYIHSKHITQEQYLNISKQVHYQYKIMSSKQPTLPMFTINQKETITSLVKKVTDQVLKQ